MSLSDLAYECIAPLFSLDERKQYFRIRTFIDELPQPLNEIDEKDLFIVFREFLSTIINVEIARYHVELDPIGAKILRGLKLAIKHSSISRTTESVFGTILELLNTNLQEQMSEFPIELLERKLVVRNAMFKESPAFIREVEIILGEQGEYRSSVRLYDLVAMRKKYLQTEEKELLKNSMADTSLDHLFSHHEIHLIKEQTIRFMQRKANAMYVEKRKLDLQDVTVLIKTLRNIIDGWFSEDGNHTLFIDHLRQYIPVTKAEYDQHWKTRVEYLVKLTKIYIAEKIEK